MPPRNGPFPRGLLLVSAAIVVVSGCEALPSAPPPDLHGRLSLVVDHQETPVGAWVVVAVRLDSGTTLTGLQGRLRFDPRRLRFAGQALGELLVHVREADSSRGELRIVTASTGGIPVDAITLAFTVLQPGYSRGLRFEVEEAVAPGPRGVRVPVHRGVVEDGGLRLATIPRRLSLADWVAHLGLAASEPGILARLPGEGTVYGDVTLNGSVSALDAALVGNLAVGNVPLLTDTGRDYVVAANVAPFNLPGLGEASDPVPPGRNSDGTWAVTVLDVAFIQTEALGQDEPVVGEPIPGRAPKAGRVLISGQIDSGTTRRLSADTVYELQGIVTVRRGGALQIAPGVRIEGDGDSEAALVVERGAWLEAVGTRLEPIVFACADAGDRGCWGGLEIRGYGPLNHGTPGGGSDVLGCPELASPRGGAYGGCLPNDGSARLRYVRIHGAGRGIAGRTGAGLALLGTGVATLLDSVQVEGSGGDGLLVSGGATDLRHVVLSRNAAAGLHWSDGWVGRGQFLIIHQDLPDGDAVRGANHDANPSSTPRSAPAFANVTLVRQPGGPGLSAGGRGIHLEHGTAATFDNVALVGPHAPAIDLSGAETCALAASGGVAVRAAIFDGGAPDFAVDADCIDESAWLLDPQAGNRVTPAGLLAPFVALSPDLRPEVGSAAATGAGTPPSNGFFDGSAAWVGAVAPANSAGNVLPWYPAWTRWWGGAP